MLFNPFLPEMRADPYPAYHLLREADPVHRVPFEIEYRIRGRDGRYRWFLARAMAAREADGSVSRWFGTCTDVDDQKRAQQSSEPFHPQPPLDMGRRRPAPR